MRLVIDMQGAQTASRYRGIGRYTMSLVKAVAQARGAHDIVLALNAAYADSIDLIRDTFEGVLPQDRIITWQAHGDVSGHDPENDARRKAAETVREAFLLSLQPDVIWIPSLFEEFGENAVTSIGTYSSQVPVAVTLHDLIPAMHKNVYLRNSEMRRWYFGKLEHLRRADLLLSVSDSSGREAQDVLGIPEDSIVTVPNAHDDIFKPLAVTELHRRRLKLRYEITGNFLLYAGGTDQRKFVDGLVSAVAGLPDDLKEQYKLVLAGRDIEAERETLLAHAALAGLDKEKLIFTGYVTDADLALLYNACSLFVFPSWHEGFGLPPLEAMACGSAVIAANSSSLPEVVGRKDALFAPRNIGALTKKITEVLRDPLLRSELGEHGLIQAENFSWSRSAERAWKALEQLHLSRTAAKSAPAATRSRPKLAFVSPLPPEKTGIADYSAELLPELARHYDITVISDQTEENVLWGCPDIAMRSVTWFRTHAKGFDRILYQFGNSPFHGHMFDLLPLFPGTVVLHDFFLSWPVWHRDEHGPQRHGWTRALLAQSGWTAVRDRLNVKNWDGIVDIVNRYPCNLAILQNSQGVIVHSDFSRRLVAQFHGPEIGSDWKLIPHLRRPSYRDDKLDVRNALKLPTDAFVLCSFGMVAPTKLNHRVLEAWLASSLARDERCHLVFVGEHHAGDYGQSLDRMIARSSARQRIRITGWVDEDLYHSWLSAADAGVQLRTLSRGETSGTVLHCMSYALPTIVNAHGSMADLPHDVVWMLDDEFSDIDLVKALEKLASDRELCQTLGEKAREHIRLFHAPRACALQYHDAIELFSAKAKLGVSGVLKALEQQVPPLPAAEWAGLAESLAVNFPSPVRPRQLLLDISALVKTELHTGIERVTRALLQTIALNPPQGWVVEPIYATAEQQGYRYARAFMSKFLGVSTDWAEDRPVEIWPGDSFFGLDFEPHVTIAQEAWLLSLRRRGVPVHFVIHDLLPVLMPEVFPPIGPRETHQRWLQTVAQFDGAFCVSRAVADEFLAWLKRFGPERKRNFELRWFHHGADLDTVPSAPEMPPEAEATLAQLRLRPSFLVVGTIEPRKAYLQVLKAFDQVWAENHEVNLVILGKEGWKGLPNADRRDIPQTVQTLKTHPELGRRLFWLADCNDAYLEQVYGACSCLIAASLGEGFGLPLIEAARHGLPLLVRDLPVFREVTAGKAAFFADRSEATVIATAVLQWLKTSAATGNDKTGVIPYQNWNDSARQVLDGILGREPAYRLWSSAARE